MCRDWENNHDYQKFYRLLSSMAFSCGTKLKTTSATVSLLRQSLSPSLFLDA